MVKPIPEGLHAVTPQIMVREAHLAIDFYKKAFGATEVSRSIGPGGKVIHAAIKIGGSTIFVADEFPDMGAKGVQSFGGSPVTIALYVPDADATFKSAVAAGATGTMPLMNMFWGDRFGKVTDPFGLSWSIATHIEDVPPDEMARRSKEFFSKQKPG
jgi:PhnB protein